MVSFNSVYYFIWMTTFCEDGLMMFDWPKHVVKIKMK